MILLTGTGMHEVGEGLTAPVGSLPGLIGWELKPEGLCQGPVCVPVRDDLGDPVSLEAVAGALGQRLVIDTERGVAAISTDAVTRQRVVAGGEAVDAVLPDLDGADRSLSEWAGKKKLLVCWASW